MENHRNHENNTEDLGNNMDDHGRPWKADQLMWKTT